MTIAPPTKSQFTAQKNGLRFFGADLELLVTTQRRNAEAMIQMSRMTLDGVQQAWQRRLDCMEQAIDGLTAHIGSFGNTNGLDGDRLAKQAEYSRKAFEKNLAIACELTELTAKTANAAMSISQRFCACVDELCPAREKQNSVVGNASRR